MNIQQLHAIAMELAHQGWVRCYSHRNAPNLPALMSIQVLSADQQAGQYKPAPVDALLARGFRLEKQDGSYVYLIERK